MLSVCLKWSPWAAYLARSASKILRAATTAGAKKWASLARYTPFLRDSWDDSQIGQARPQKNAII